MAVLISLWSSIVWIGVLVMFTEIWLASAFVLSVAIVLAPGPAVVITLGPADVVVI